MSRFGEYRVIDYGTMLVEAPRMDAYVAALKAAVTPGCTVVDLGTGTGMFAMLACRFGAGRVHAIEPDKSILLARQAAEANGFADRISFHQAFSTDLAFEDRADVLISDLRGVLPLYTAHIPSIVDARTRLLKPGGIQIPRRDRMNVALVEMPKVYRYYEEPWLTNRYGLDLTSAHPFVVSSWHKVEAKPEDLLTSPVLWAELDYTTITGPNVAGRASSAVARPGTAHGLAVWFDAEIAPGVGFSNAPGKTALIYGQAFFPLKAAVPVEEGDTLEVDLRADHIEGDYVWTWATKIVGAGDGKVKADFRQSTFYAEPVDPEKMRRRGAGYVPERTPGLDLERLCLSLVDGQRTLEAIAGEVARTYPARYKTWQSALTDVVKIIDRAK